MSSLAELSSEGFTATNARAIGDSYQCIINTSITIEYSAVIYRNIGTLLSVG